MKKLALTLIAAAFLSVVVAPTVVPTVADAKKRTKCYDVEKKKYVRC